MGIKQIVLNNASYFLSMEPAADLGGEELGMFFNFLPASLMLIPVGSGRSLASDLRD